MRWARAGKRVLCLRWHSSSIDPLLAVRADPAAGHGQARLLPSPARSFNCREAAGFRARGHSACSDPCPVAWVGLCPAAGSRSQTAATVGSRSLAAAAPGRWLRSGSKTDGGLLTSRAGLVHYRPGRLSARPGQIRIKCGRRRAAHGAREGRLERKRRPRRREAARILRFVSRSPRSLRSSLRSPGSGASHKKGAA